jgi:hypothetical protein
MKGSTLFFFFVLLFFVMLWLERHRISSRGRLRILLVAEYHVRQCQRVLGP